MPMFQWQPPPQPNEGTITDLLLRGPEAMAQAAQTAGNARAAAQANSGNIWGHAIDTIGQTVAAVPQQIEAAKTHAIANEAAQMNLDAMRRDAKSRFALESALKNPDNRRDDGSIDTEKVTNALRDQDVGAWQTWQSISAASQKNAADLAEKIANINKTTVEIQEKRRLAAQAQADYLGRMAYTAINTLNEKPGDPLHARDVTLSAVARAAADGAISEPDAKQFVMQTATATPDQLSQVFSSFVPPELKGKLEKEAADTAKAKAEAAKNAAEAANITKYGRTTPPEPQHVQFLLNGKPVMGSFVPDSQGGRFQYNGQDVTAQAQPIPPASVQVMNQQGGSAEAIADAIESGLQPPDLKGLYRFAAPVKAELARRGYDQSTALLDWNATQRYLNTLNGQQQTRLRQATQTAFESLDVIDSLAQQWDNLRAVKGSNLGPLNRAELTAAKNGAYGQDAASVAHQLEAQISDLTSELGNVYMGGNTPTDHSLQLAGRNLSADWSAQTLKDMTKLARTNLKIRLNSMQTIGPVTATSRETQPVTPTQAPVVPSPAVGLGLFGTTKKNPF